jgi:hypothetical protein
MRANLRILAKAAIILSESCVLEDINACFNPVEIDEKDATFKLGFDVLSEHSWSFETRWILERFIKNTSSYSNVFDGNYDQIPPTNDRNFAKVIRTENTATQANSRDSDIHLTYETNPYWSEHRHPKRAWDDDIHSKISWSLKSCPSSQRFKEALPQSTKS